MRSMMKRTTFREIKQSLGRYLAIVAIVALGVAFFAGLKICRPDMVETADCYLKEGNFYDYRLLTTLGIDEEDVEAISKVPGVTAAESGISQDIICLKEDDTEIIVAAHSILQTQNFLTLKEGRLPDKSNECVVDSSYYTKEDIGKEIRLSSTNASENLDLFTYDSYTIVGLVQSPTYLNYERGTTSVGNGVVTTFMYLLKDGFESEYDTEMYVKMDVDTYLYDQAYDDYIEEHADAIEEALTQSVNKRYADLYDEAQTKIKDAKEELESNVKQAEEELEDAKQELEEGASSIEEAKTRLKEKEEELSKAQKQIEEAQKQLDSQQEQINLLAMMDPQQAEIMNVQLQAAMEELTNQETQIRSGQQQIADAKEEIEASEKELEDGQAEYERGVAELSKETQEAKEKIAQAEEDLAQLKEPSVYVLDRSSDTGYTSFDSDTSIVEGVSSVFPIFFFAVAALVCMTTMTRMVEDERTQIGVLKALGYGEFRIMGKYLFYAGSAAISGAIIGILVGFTIFPKVIWMAYGMMYSFADLEYTFSVPLTIISLLASIICSMGATYVSCESLLRAVPASLIRPKAPKNGKRILLERIGWIWKRLKFLQKVSIRNVFRYKKRFVMMVLGISGCTALLLTGFGLNDSVKSVVADQYDNISIYDVLLSVSEEMTQENFQEKLAPYLESYVFVDQSSVKVSFDGTVKNIYAVYPDNWEELVDKFVLKDANSGKMLEYPKKGQAVLTSKVADKLGVKTGDIISVQDTDLNTMEVSVTGICENYVQNYIFIDPSTYEEETGKDLQFLQVYANFKSDIDIHEAGAEMLGIDHVSAVVISADIKDRFQNMMVSLNYVILLVIICAATLAFIVLYNLTNINITERIREIATIKVLGFYPNETASYVFRENLMLTAIGAIVGLVLGKWLHKFVLYNIDMDMVSFNEHIQLLSFCMSVIMTFVFAMLVNFVMYFKLQKINMAESLKSIE